MLKVPSICSHARFGPLETSILRWHTDRIKRLLCKLKIVGSIPNKVKFIYFFLFFFYYFFALSDTYLIQFQNIKVLFYFLK